MKKCRECAGVKIKGIPHRCITSSHDMRFRGEASVDVNGKRWKAARVGRVDRSE